MSLRTAMYNNELVLHYQPVVDLTLGAVVGVEALVRWMHPSDGLIGPDQFIPVAEASGLIVALGTWVLDQAATQAVRWRAEGLSLDMAVNLSTRQVAHLDLVPTVARVLRETGLDPHRLVFEVTESAVMEDAEAAAAVLNRITEMGVSLSIDDFGTGYNSLVYLKRYLIRSLKIDRSFTAGMGVNAEDDAIVASVIGLAKAVGGSCIAEGIETQEQYVALRSLRCGFGQGWLFGRAVPAEELPELIAECEAKLAALALTFPQENEHRDQTADRRDQVADRRDQVADQRDQIADQRDQIGDQRDQTGDQASDQRDERDQASDQASDQRDQASDQRDQASDQRDETGDQRDQTGDQRDQTGDQRRDQTGDQRRDQTKNQRDQTKNQRDQTKNQRDQTKNQRDETRNQRDRAGDQRNQASDQRDQASDQRDQASDQRDQASDQRDQASDQRDRA
ncbi:EAL domain-containing protein [Cryobacterium roopkundense]|nr:EAL domain-containing protein [Cryobacterium roopkundense]